MLLEPGITALFVYDMEVYRIQHAEEVLALWESLETPTMSSLYASNGWRGGVLVCPVRSMTAAKMSCGSMQSRVNINDGDVQQSGDEGKRGGSWRGY